MLDRTQRHDLNPVPWYIHTKRRYRSTSTDQISSASAVASDRREDLQGVTSERKATLVLGELSRISCNSPLIGRFETRNVSTDNPRRALHYPRRREREDANPPHEQAEEGQMLPKSKGNPPGRGGRTNAAKAWHQERSTYLLLLSVLDFTKGFSHSYVHAS